MFVVVFVVNKFRQYLLGSKVMVFINHSSLKRLMEKKDAKPRLIQWYFSFKNFTQNMGQEG